jgi:hypothetical protein
MIMSEVHSNLQCLWAKVLAFTAPGALIGGLTGRALTESAAYFAEALGVCTKETRCKVVSRSFVTGGVIGAACGLDLGASYVTGQSTSAVLGLVGPTGQQIYNAIITHGIAATAHPLMTLAYINGAAIPLSLGLYYAFSQCDKKHMGTIEGVGAAIGRVLPSSWYECAYYTAGLTAACAAINHAIKSAPDLTRAFWHMAVQQCPTHAQSTVYGWFTNNSMWSAVSQSTITKIAYGNFAGLWLGAMAFVAPGALIGGLATRVVAECVTRFAENTGLCSTDTRYKLLSASFMLGGIAGATLGFDFGSSYILQQASSALALLDPSAIRYPMAALALTNILTIPVLMYLKQELASHDAQQTNSIELVRKCRKGMTDGARRVSELVAQAAESVALVVKSVGRAIPLAVVVGAIAAVQYGQLWVAADAALGIASNAATAMQSIVGLGGLIDQTPIGPYLTPGVCAASVILTACRALGLSVKPNALVASAASYGMIVGAGLMSSMYAGCVAGTIFACMSSTSLWSMAWEKLMAGSSKPVVPQNTPTCATTAPGVSESVSKTLEGAGSWLGKESSAEAENTDAA